MEEPAVLGSIPSFSTFLFFPLYVISLKLLVVWLSLWLFTQFTDPSQLALLQKTQELSYRLNAYKSACDTEDPKDLSAANGVDIDTQTQHGVDLDKVSPLDLQDIQNSHGACEYMVRSFFCHNACSTVEKERRFESL